MPQLASWIQCRDGSKLVRLYPAKNHAATYTMKRRTLSPQGGTINNVNWRHLFTDSPSNHIGCSGPSKINQDRQSARWKGSQRKNCLPCEHPIRQRSTAKVPCPRVICVLSHLNTGSYFARVGTHKNQDSHIDNGRGLPAPESLGQIEFSVPRGSPE